MSFDWLWKETFHIRIENIPLCWGQQAMLPLPPPPHPKSCHCHQTTFISFLLACHPLTVVRQWGLEAAAGLWHLDPHCHRLLIPPLWAISNIPVTQIWKGWRGLMGSERCHWWTRTMSRHKRHCLISLCWHVSAVCVSDWVKVDRLAAGWWWFE